MSKHKKIKETAKIIVIGETGVGKSSIIDRFVNDNFNPNGGYAKGTNISKRYLEFPELNRKIKLNIWDTVPQEGNKSFEKILYKDANVIIFVYDITNKDSLEKLKNFWYNEISENMVERPVYAVAGNKIDLYEQEKVEEAEGKEFADEIGAIFKCVSASNGKGIENLFTYIGKKLIDRSYDYTIEETLTDQLMNTAFVQDEASTKSEEIKSDSFGSSEPGCYVY